MRTASFGTLDPELVASHGNHWTIRWSAPLGEAVAINEAGLEAIGDNLFLETPPSGPPNASTPGSAGFGTILQGFLETSNVNAVTEITSLITAQRAYELNSKVVSASDEMLRTVNNMR